MQCSCGAETLDHEVTEQGDVVGKFAQCKSCGRIRWWYDKREKEKTGTDVSITRLADLLLTGGI